MIIQELITQTRNLVEQHGFLMPTVRAQVEQEHYTLALEAFMETQSVPWQQGLVARQGWDLAKQHPGERLVAASFVALAWKSAGEITEFALQPRRDPHRQEIVTVQGWTAEDDAIQTYRLAVQREGERITVGEPELVTETKFTFLNAFLDGYRDGQRPDEEVLAEVERTIDQRFAAFSSEQQQAILRLIEDALG